MASSSERAGNGSATVRGAFAGGLARVMRARTVWLGVWAMTLVLSFIVSLALRDTIAAHLNDSTVADRVARGVEWDWWQEFQQQATALGTTFVPSIIGGAAPLRNLSDLADNRPLAKGLFPLLAAWLLLWSFASGGIFDRLARDRRVGGQAFFGACGRYAMRLLRLGALAIGAYWVLYAWVHAWIFDVVYASLIRDLTVERSAFLLRVVGYAIFLALLVAVNLVVDYARIRLVVEDRRSVLFALAAGARFVARHLGLVAGLYALNTAVFVAIVGLYVALAPGGRNDDGRLWIALAAGQAYLLARAFLKLQFIASQIGVFQHALASDVLVSSPAPEWPESPAAEFVRNADDTSPLTP